MSDDLISRKALLDIFRRNSIFEHITNAAGKNVIEIIKEQPTAYDMDKVTEQLETRRSLLEVARMPKSAKSAAYTAYSLAIETVRKGGINEDE